MMSRSIAVIAATLLAFWAAPAAAQDARPTQSAFVQGSLNLAAGERVTLRRLDDGSFELVKTERIEFSEVAPPANATPADAGGLVSARPGTITFALHLRRDVGSLLRIENATSDGLKYMGFIRRVSGGQVSAPARTSTCTVPPGKAVFEHWQEPVIQVVAADFSDIAGDMPVCESHDVNE